MVFGFNHRLEKDLTTALGGARLAVLPDPRSPERGYNAKRASAAWVGASMLASLETYGAVAVTRGEWEEHGESIVHRKGF